MAKNVEKKPIGKAKKAPKKQLLSYGSEERPFRLEFDGKILHLGAEDVSALAQQVLYQAMLPGHVESTDRVFDKKGRLVSETTTTEHVPGDWQAAAAWLHLQAQGAIS